jgi:hypothetical protein
MCFRTQSTKISEFLDLSIVRYSKKLENTTFRIMNLFLRPQMRVETPNLLGTLERTNLSHWTSRVKFRVTLRVAVYRQSVSSWRQAP